MIEIEAKQRLSVVAAEDQKVIQYLKRNKVEGPYMELFQKMKKELKPKHLAPLGLALGLMNDGEDHEDALSKVYFGSDDKQVKKQILKELKASITAGPITGPIEKGSFHKWLGKAEDEPITNADIEKGLKSDDPHVRKMANFARNARKWKH